MNCLLKWIAVGTLVVSLGGHWALLQGMAWTSMFVRFSESMPVSQGRRASSWRHS